MIHRPSKALQAALAAVDASSTDPIVAAKIRGLMHGYDRRWGDHDYEVLAVEYYLDSPLTNPETMKTSRTFRAAGKIDLKLRRNCRRTIVDHKTTSQDIQDPSGAYWRQLAVEGQVSHYELLEWANGDKIDDAVWDVVRKPTISPKKLTKAEVRSVVANRKYFDWPISDTSVQDVAVNERETPEMYEARLAFDCTRERPEWYFQRRTIPRLDAEILEYAQELWEHGQEILHARNLNRYARNSGACLLYGTPCKFLGICSGHDTPDSDRWMRKQCVHEELEGIDGDGRDLLTNSRIRCFQTCRRKHFYQYELGITRVEDSDSEALLFGSAWHHALEAYFLSFA